MIKWITVIVLTVLLAFSIELILMLMHWFDTDTSDLAPWTFHWVWELIAILGIYFVVKKCNVNFGTFSAAIVIGGIGGIFIPNFLNEIEANFYGVQSRVTLDTHEEGRYDEKTEYDFPLNLGYLYKNNDPALFSDFEGTNEDNEYVETKGFLFWQTGLAYGFIPNKIDEYNGGKTFLNHVELFFTVGPMVLVEFFIMGIYSKFLILLFAQIVWIFFKKEHFWWYKE